VAGGLPIEPHDPGVAAVASGQADPIANRRARLIFVTLSCTRFERSLSPVLGVLHEWLDSWAGIGVIERGMARQGYDLQPTRYANESIP